MRRMQSVLSSAASHVRVNLLAVIGTLVGCTAPEPPPQKDSAPTATATSTAAAAGSGEVVFDPKNPPPGWVNCHRNHCHHEDGRVASYAQVMQEIGAKKMVGGEAAKAAPAAPADVAAPPANAEKTSSGLASVVLKKGEGSKKPGPKSIVTVHYTGWTPDGKSFDSSIPRGRPAQFPLDKVIPGWIEGIQLMTEGEERRLWVPEALGYGGAAGKPTGPLVFDVELVSVRD
jgi:FKBP-type peptidyl-prolyl cis-trans isomerase